ncbi:bifunctional diaminohydroxyphosphoribosylaminopyrimidine deaminase/5-amino-6-(5-phosphoribosylamino)uracil reductase RibD [Pontibacterium granulatum]|uniref:bifunctional diaminohydroxyphosphoribosylaminopyrimidine deaminase/5-amino-6-(5-phosphoribosylamino)uracil reductase RibD n=1 Tax=Pontibacterium granulatum TaxID=2036029 RepID=UPI00249B774D|nr:bifunctional diaminohydroxyphosphoribosylaminopyrimidine deaminase/5-amino-6-(5-phosphoribosylamino)uracil reductase RibD [Pontibacterium granulatum]MDI3324712.1 bifunctional diaminohydroxyphosphoribosylaminopyrimidine deaminase/5-amino-6-(5-phosphoribosylamino)uracil reductase RibD [Pontibacterium granulatum]
MSTFSMADRRWMARAIQLADQGRYTTQPNPRVGCVIVRDGELMGEGYHVRAGEGHAEVNALRMAGDLACGATAYVTLEPCSHFGKTPPCAEALKSAGVARVVSAMVDPNPQVAGRGIRILQDAGIDASYGLLEAEAKLLNPGFIKRMEQGLPYVRVKTASSLDGRTAMQSGESQWITGAAARSDVQRLRAQSSVIVTGVDSILHDDSSLTVREHELHIENAAQAAEKQPLRVVMDSQLRMPLQAKILTQPGRTLIATLSDDAEKIAELEAAGAEVVRFDADNGRISIAALLRHLASAEQCNELLVETGATLAGAFIRAGVVDELVVYQAMTLLGSDARPMYELPYTQMAQQIRMQLLDSRMLGDDLKLTLRPVLAESNESN